MVDWSDRGHVLATRDDNVVYCRVVGQGNMNNCAPFQAYSTECQNLGYTHFVLDFSLCDGLDSTFLGVLVGIALGEGHRRCDVVVINAQAAVVRILGEVGIDRLVTVCPDGLGLPDVPLDRLTPVNASPGDRANMILRAHENLCEVDPTNQDRFGNFIERLRAELRTFAEKTGRPPVHLGRSSEE